MDLSTSILAQLDFGNREDHSQRTKVINIVVISTTFVIITARTLIRIGIIRQLSLEDIIIIFAALFQIGFSAEVLYALQFGLGKHVWLAATRFDNIIPQVRQIVEVLFFANITYITSITLVKLSIITCYIRVFPNKAMRWFCAIVGFLILSVWICSIFTTIFTCSSKVSDQWEFDNVNRKCIMVIPYYYFASAMNALTDIALTVAPVPLLLRINVSRREKFILCILFGMGLFAGACSIVRLVSLRNLYSVDISFQSSDTLDWSTIELGVGIFCASVPSFKPLLGRRWMTTTRTRETAVGAAAPAAKSHNNATTTTKQQPSNRTTTVQQQQQQQSSSSSSSSSSGGGGGGRYERLSGGQGSVVRMGGGGHAEDADDDDDAKKKKKKKPCGAVMEGIVTVRSLESGCWSEDPEKEIGIGMAM